MFPFSDDSNSLKRLVLLAAVSDIGVYIAQCSCHTVTFISYTLTWSSSELVRLHNYRDQYYVGFCDDSDESLCFLATTNFSTS